MILEKRFKVGDQAVVFNATEWEKTWDLPDCILIDIHCEGDVENYECWQEEGDVLHKGQRSSVAINGFKRNGWDVKKSLCPYCSQGIKNPTKHHI